MKSVTSSFNLLEDSKLDVVLSLEADRGLFIRFILAGSLALHADICIHWGITLSDRPNSWISPDRQSPALRHFCWNDRETKVVPGAAQTSFAPSKIHNQKEAELLFENITAKTPTSELPRNIEFVLYRSPNHWIKHGKTNFSVCITSFLQSVFCENQLQEAASSLVNNRLLKTPQSLHRIYRWVVQSNISTFNLLAFILSGDPNYCIIFFFTDTSHPLLLHWAGALDQTSPWIRPDPRHLQITDPEDSKSEEFCSHPFDDKALQTGFSFLTKSGESPIQYLRLVLCAGGVPSIIKFVLKEGKSNNWFKNKGEDFVVEICNNPEYERKKKQFEAEEKLRRLKEEQDLKAKEACWFTALEEFQLSRESRKVDGDVTFQSVSLSDDIGEMDIIARFNEEESMINVDIIGCIKCPVTLHWGVIGEAGQRQRYAPQEWRCPPPQYRPPNTCVVDPNRSCESPMTVFTSLGTNAKISDTEDHVASSFFQSVTVKIPGQRDAPGSEYDSGVIPEVMGVVFVLREVNGSRWFKAKDNSDIVVRLSSSTAGSWPGAHPEVVDEILSAEVGWHHMTLMHRYNLINHAVSKWHDNQTGSESEVLMRSWTALFRPEGVRNIMDSPGKHVPPRNLSKGASSGVSDEATVKENCDFWAWIYVWSRFSYMGILDWQRNYNTKPRELAHATESLTYKLADLWIRWPELRPLIRLVLSTVARGGHQGQAIRDRILDIMHKHKIPENRANFYEQWHQKLHNNTTPDDIPICLSIIAYLKTNNLQEYWKVLTDHGITKQRLGSYERPITSEPYAVHTDVGSLIYDFEQYLDILKDVHDSLDLKKAFDHAIQYLSSDTTQCVRDVVNKTTVSGISLKGGTPVHHNELKGQEHERFVAVSEARRKVLYLLTRPNILPDAVRELLFLDFALEQQQGLSLQGSCTNFTVPQLSKQLTDMIVNISGHHSTDEELSSICRDWLMLGDSCANGKFSSEIESALMLKALADRVSLFVGSLIEQWQEWFGPKAEYLGQQIGVDQHVLNVFVDEVLRGSILFGISITLKRLEPKLREAAHLPPWQMISIVPRVQGQLQKVDRLINIQDKIYEVPTILLSGSVSGEEEIPSGVQAVLVRSAAESPDILSHVSVRARNAHVLLSVCFDPCLTEDLETLIGQWVELIVPSHGADMTYTLIAPPSLEKLERKASRLLIRSFDRQKTQSRFIDDILISGAKTTKMDLTTPSERWVVAPEEFSRKTVGSKSLNLAKLRPLLPPSIVTPQAIALPYGCLQKALGTGINKEKVLGPLTKCVGQLKPDTSNLEADEIFREARGLITQLEFPVECRKELEKRMREAADSSEKGLIALYEDWGPEATWNSICTVWSSLFGLRPWVSLSKARRQYHELNMAVLIQELLPANYAFVLHSKNPFAEKAIGEMYGEMVPGLGEVLVGNAPGRALSWKMKRDQNPIVVSFPSKQFALRGSSCLISRSDSNGEDLEGFAGAGLFESVPSAKNQKVVLSYATVKLVRDAEYRRRMLKKIGDLAFLIEDIFGAPMDIEGVVLNDETLGVVQARPQV